MKCIICGQNSWAKKYNSLLECTNCSFTRAKDKYFNIDPKKIYSRKYFEGEDYANYANEKEALQNNFKKRLNTIRKYKRGGKLLEIGSAFGYFLELSKKYYNSYGIDVDKEVTSIAKRNSGVKIFTGDFYKTNVGKNYDVICMFDVIEHLKNPDKFINKIYSILKPGGILAIETGNINGLLPKLQGGKWRLIKPPHHLQYFSRETLINFLNKYGFTVKESNNVSFTRTIGQIVYRLVNKKISFFAEKEVQLNTFDILLVIAQKPISN